MSKRASSLQYTVRISIAMVLIALLAVVLVGQASANQSGPGVNESSEFQQKICQGGGGTATVDVNRTIEGITGVHVRCKGGWFDGLHCYNGRYTGTYCFFESQVQSQDDVVEPTGGIEENTGEVIDTPIVADEVFEPDLVEDPLVEQPEVTHDPLLDEPEVIEDVVEPIVAEDPLVEEVTDPIVDVPVVDEVIEPVVAEDPLVEKVVPIDITTVPITVEEPVWEYDLDYEIEVEEPIVIE